MTAPPIPALVIFLVFWLVCAAVCLIWPEKVQTVAIKASSKWPDWFLKYYPFARWTKEWMRTAGYLWYLRATGAFLIVVIFSLAVIVLRPH